MKKCKHCKMPCGDVCRIKDPVTCEDGHIVSFLKTRTPRSKFDEDAKCGHLISEIEVFDGMIAKRFCTKKVFDLPGPRDALHASGSALISLGFAFNVLTYLGPSWIQMTLHEVDDEAAFLTSIGEYYEE